MIIQVLIVAALADIVYTDDFEDIFAAFLLTLTLSSLALQSLGHILAIVFGKVAVVVSILIIAWMVLFMGIYITPRDVSDLFEDTMMSSDPIYNCIAHMMVLIYGFGRCPEGYVSSVIYKLDYNDDDFDDSTLILVYEVIFFRLLSYICLKLKVNWYRVELLIKSIKTKLRMIQGYI